MRVKLLNLTKALLLTHQEFGTLAFHIIKLNHYQIVSKFKHVSFHDNQIQVLDGDLIKNNPMIDVIRFNGNHLHIIGHDLLQHLKFLEVVWLQHNLCIDMETAEYFIYEMKNYFKKACFNETFENESKSLQCTEKRLPEQQVAQLTI